MRSPGLWQAPYRCEFVATGNKQQEAGSKQQAFVATGNKQQEAGSKQQAAESKQQAARSSSKREEEEERRGESRSALFKTSTSTTGGLGKKL